MLEGDPVSLMLKLWLDDVANRGRSVSAGTLFDELGKLARDNKSLWPFTNAKVLAQRLNQLKTALKEEFEVEVSEDRHTHQKLYRFWPKGAGGGAGGRGGH